MKIAVNTCNWNAYTKTKGIEFNFIDFLHDAKNAGCDGVEVASLDKKFSSPTDARKIIEDFGLEIAAYGASVTYNPWLPNIEDYQKAIRFASGMNIKILMVCGGFLRNQRRNTYNFDYDIFASSIIPAVKFAKEHGMQIAFHPHRGCICENIEETRKITERVPELRICVDIAHIAACGEDPVKFILTFKDKIIYTHIKDYDWESDLFMELGRGDGKLDIRACINALTNINYNGWLTIELDRPWNESLLTPLESTKTSIGFLS
ncbi:MAG TPA: sugar phosphate isomerase/epimerase [Victivallales bacterium]|nr:sugar phosphate isomerase/epimerase [Victivallales bacterium]HRR28040.1 sugar phosphate isomerase/epimerase [Victivallales bacterium]HRU01380.1 sugar phosphate isomerase/epimerase [Victivallales bacterium]